MNPKIVLGKAVSGIYVNDVPTQVFQQGKGGENLESIKTGQLSLEPTDAAPYIDIAGELNRLSSVSTDIATDKAQTTLTPAVKTSNNNLVIFDANNNSDGGEDQYGDTYENAYALKLTKQSSTDKSQLLPGAQFTLQYPQYPQDEKDYDPEADLTWVDMKPDSDLPITDEQGQPTYDANGKLVTKKAALYDANHQVITTTAPNGNLTVATSGDYAGDYLLTTNNKGEISVAVNVTGAYQFREVAAPAGYAMPDSVDTDITAFRTSSTPIARQFNVNYSDIMQGAQLYFLNVDLTKDAAPIQINVNFNGQSADVDMNAPNMFLVSPQNSPDKQTLTTMAAADINDFQKNIKSIELDKAEIRAANYNKILWNFVTTDKPVDANSEEKPDFKPYTGTINLDNDTFYGTVLAPQASFYLGNAAKVYGSVIGQTVTVGSGAQVYRWDLSYQPWSNTDDGRSNNRLVENVPIPKEETKLVSLKFTKFWKNLDGDDSAPSSASVKLQLMQRVKFPDPSAPDGTRVEDSPVADSTVTLPHDNSWSGGFNNLPLRTKAGSAIQYFMTETVTGGGDYTPVYAQPVPSETTTLNDDKHTTLTTQTSNITNTEFGFDLTKLAKDTHQQLSGATYTLTNVDTGHADEIDSDETTSPRTVVKPGTYLLQETRAPDGYTLNDTIYALRLYDSGSETTGSNYRWHQATLTSKTVAAGEKELSAGKIHWTMPETNNNGFSVGSPPPYAANIQLVHFTQEDEPLPEIPITITKVASNDDASNDATKPLSGAEFSWGPVGDTKTLITNDDGKLISKDSEDGKDSLVTENGTRYLLQETKAPKGYALDKTAIYVENGVLVDKDGKQLTDEEISRLPVTLAEAKDSGGVKSLTFKDHPLWSVKVVKLDANTNKQIDGSEFTLSSSPEDSATSVLTPTATGSSDAAELAMGASYKLTETQPPDGYVPLNGDISIDTQTTDDPPTIYWQGGQLKEADASAQVTWHVTGDHVITITVKDPKKGILPKTGGTGPLVPLILATMTFVASAGLFLLARTQRKAGERR